MTTKKDPTKHILKQLRGVACTTGYYAVKDLKDAPWNPDIRVQLKYLGALRESMHQHGFWEWAPIITDREGIIIDGHRRKKAAELEHIEEVPVTMVDVDAQQLWADFNGTVMRLTGAQTLQAIGKGLTARPAHLKAVIDKLEDVVGKEGLRTLGDMGKSPRIYDEAKRIANYCDHGNDKIFMRKTIYWLARHTNMSVMSKRAIQDFVPAANLVAAIYADAALTANYGVR